MKIFPAAVFLLFCFFSGYHSLAQDSAIRIPQSPKPVKHKHIVKDSAAQIITADTSATAATVEKPAVKPIRHKRSIRDSLAMLKAARDSAYNALPDSVKVYIRDSVARADSLREAADSVAADSVNRHWAGWKKFQVQPGHSYTLYSKGVLKGKSKSQLQYNIADFYLYLNGQIVKPPKSGYFFFAAGCLCFKYDDTLLLNSGLGFKVGVGVGIKILDGRFTSTLHANTHNKEVYKFSKDDTSYVKSMMAVPLTQSLKLKSEPTYASDEIITGEYRATYRKFYQKNDDDEDEVRQYNVRIMFRCRVSGGIDSTPGGSGSK